MTEADILAMTYTDSCVISRLVDSEDPETGITTQQYKPTHEQPLPCALSQTGLGQAGGLDVLEGAGLMNVTINEYRLFLRPEIEILKGDRVEVSQGCGLKHLLFAKQPFYYSSHCEVNLTGRDPNEY